MKKAVLIAAMFCSVASLSSCCRVVDCCFEDPCSTCNPCEVIRKKERSCSSPCGSYAPSCSNPCGSSDTSKSQSPQVKGCTSFDGKCKQ